MLRSIAYLARLAPLAPIFALARAQLTVLDSELAVIDLSAFKFYHHRNSLLVDVLEHIDERIS